MLKGVLLREITPEDIPKMRALFKSFSKETVRKRFFEKIREMSYEMLKRYCVLDKNKEFAIVAELPDKHLIGVARATILKEGIAEVAIVVTDKYQRQGIGKRLHKAVEEKAKQKYIKKLVAIVERSNNVAISFFKSIGYKLKETQNSEVILEKEIA